MWPLARADRSLRQQGPLPRNSVVTDDRGGDRLPPNGTGGVPGRRQTTGSPSSPETDQVTVTDEDRTRYGLLLDSAAERGLLGTYEYEVRLRDLASATSFEELNRIVSELPVFTAPTAAPSKQTRRSASTTARHSMAGGIGRKRPVSHWLMLAMLVLVAIAALVVLSVYIRQLARNHHAGLAPPAPARVVSARL